MRIGVMDGPETSEKTFVEYIHQLTVAAYIRSPSPWEVGAGGSGG